MKALSLENQMTWLPILISMLGYPVLFVVRCRILVRSVLGSAL